MFIFETRISFENKMSHIVHHILNRYHNCTHADLLLFMFVKNFIRRGIFFLFTAIYTYPTDRCIIK